MFIATTCALVFLKLLSILEREFIKVLHIQVESLLSGFLKDFFAGMLSKKP